MDDKWPWPDERYESYEVPDAAEITASPTQSPKKRRPSNSPDRQDDNWRQSSSPGKPKKIPAPPPFPPPQHLYHKVNSQTSQIATSTSSGGTVRAQTIPRAFQPQVVPPRPKVEPKVIPARQLVSKEDECLALSVASSKRKAAPEIAPEVESDHEKEPLMEEEMEEVEVEQEDGDMTLRQELLRDLNDWQEVLDAREIEKNPQHESDNGETDQKDDMASASSDKGQGEGGGIGTGRGHKKLAK